MRKILLTTLQDVRVIIVKLASKLDNVRTMQNLPLEEQQRIAQEVLEVYAPLAYRLGLEKIKSNLENEARVRLNLKKEGEKVVIILPTASSTSENATSGNYGNMPNYKQWWYYFFGK